MGLMVVHGAQAGGFSPISIYGGITNGVVAEAGLPLSPMTTFARASSSTRAVALLLFLVLGGRSADAGALGGAGGGHRPAHRDREAGERPADLRRQRGRGAQPSRSARRPDRRPAGLMADPATELDGRQPLPDRHPRRPGAARDPRPRLQARHRLRGDHDRPRPRADGRRTCRSGRWARSPGPRSC